MSPFLYSTDKKKWCSQSSQSTEIRIVLHLENNRNNHSIIYLSTVVFWNFSHVHKTLILKLCRIISHLQDLCTALVKKNLMWHSHNFLLPYITVKEYFINIRHTDTQTHTYTHTHIHTYRPFAKNGIFGFRRPQNV